MVVIFSEHQDYSTIKVMEYLRHWGRKVIRINTEDTSLCKFDIKMSKTGQVIFNLFFKDELIDFSNVESVWFRRGDFSFGSVKVNDLKVEGANISKQINAYLFTERQTFNSFFYDFLKLSGIRILGNPVVYNTQKLSVLQLAAKHGLIIPQTFITNDAEQMRNTIQKSGELITKAIQDNISVLTKDHLFHSRTELINESKIHEVPDRLLPSLLQENLDKAFEIRTFYLDGEFYSVAIFSQRNEKTKIDFRNYDFDNPNRKAPIKLPAAIERKLQSVLNELSLNTASIDIVYTRQGEYVFLEINPVGQYDMVGKIMNYKLDKKIALWLMNYRNSN
jgi:ATP-GRASP peptide maturase of grasp-with-spasm system